MKCALLALAAATSAVTLKNLREINGWGALAKLTGNDTQSKARPNVFLLDLDPELLQMSFERESDPKLTFLGMEIKLTNPGALEALCDLGHTNILNLEAEAWCESLLSPETAKVQRQYTAFASSVEAGGTTGNVMLTDLLTQLASGASVQKGVYMASVEVGHKNAKAIQSLTLLGDSLVNVPHAACARIFTESDLLGWTFAFGTDKNAVSGLECDQFDAQTIKYARYTVPTEKEL